MEFKKTGVSNEQGENVKRVLVADDHESVRRGIGELIDAEQGFEVAGEAKNGIEAVEQARILNPDIAVLDMNMPQMNGLETARRITKELREVEVLILTFTDSESLAQEALHAGVHGYMLKSDASRDLMTAISSLAQRRPYFTAKVAHTVLNGYLEATANSGGSRQDLTAREREVIQLLAEGKSSKEVAVIHNIALKTAETHRMNLMRKLNLHSICDLVHYAVRNRIIDA